MSFDWRGNLEDQLRGYRDDEFVPLLMQFEWAISKWRWQFLINGREPSADSVFDDGTEIEVVHVGSSPVWEFLMAPPLEEEGESEQSEELIESALISARAKDLHSRTDLRSREMYVHALIPYSRVGEVIQRNDLMCAVIKDGKPDALLRECIGQRETSRYDGRRRRIYEKMKPLFDQFKAA